VGFIKGRINRWPELGLGTSNSKISMTRAFGRASSRALT
jgi:hypothetical protein